MSSATAVKPPATDPDYRRALEPSGPLARSTSASATTPSAAVAADAAAAAAAPGSAAAGRSRRLSVILHGKRADEPDVRAAIAALRSEGVRVDVKVTWESGDVENFVKDIVKAHSADTIVAAGGDGTLNEVVAALIKVRAPRSVAVGLMPMGTSNDFAAVTGIPQDLEGALRLCCSSDNLRQLDVGLVNGEVFMNTATLGASSELGSETSHEAKKLLGPAAYLVKGMVRLAGYAAVPVRMRFPAPAPIAPPSPPPPPATATTAAAAAAAGSASAVEAGGGGGEGGAEGITAHGEAGRAESVKVEGGTAESGRAESGKVDKKAKKSRRPKEMEVFEEVLNLTAGNNRQLASMLQACPDALLDDGLLDITFVTGGAVEGAGAVVGEILTRGLDDAQPANVRIMRVPWIEVTVESPDPDLTWPGNRDGEPVPPGRRFLLEALPRRVAMHLPESARVLLTEGADPRVNAPVIAINRLRKGAFKAMLAQVTRFRRIIPGSRPWWQSAVMALLARAPLLLLGFAVGYGAAARHLRSSERGGAGAPAAAGRGKEKPATGKEEAGGGRTRRGLTLWPIGRGRRTEVVAGV